MWKTLLPYYYEDLLIYKKIQNENHLVKTFKTSITYLEKGTKTGNKLNCLCANKREY